MLAGITANLVFVHWWRLQPFSLGFDTVIFFLPTIILHQFVFCLLVFGFKVDGLDLVACLPENLFLSCHTAASMAGSNACCGNFPLNIDCYLQVYVKALLGWYALLPDLE